MGSAAANRKFSSPTDIMKNLVFTKRSPFNQGRRALACMLLAFAGGVGAFAQNWIDVTDTYIKNADYSTGTSEGWTDGDAVPTVNATYLNAEFYVKKNTAAQKITGLKAGKYKLTVRGFHRAGSNDAGAAYEAGTEVILAYLFAGEDSVALSSLYSAPKNLTSNNLKNGWPDGMQSMREYCDLDPSYYANELEFTATEGQEMLVGISVKTNAGGSWTCWDDFKLYVDGTAIDALKAQLGKLTEYRGQFESAGATNAVEELTQLIDKYSNYTEATPEEDINNAIKDIEGQNAIFVAALTQCNSLVSIISSAEKLLSDCADGTYFAPSQNVSELQSVVDAAKELLAKTTLADMATAFTQTVEDVTTATSKLRTVVALNYTLLKAKNLADQIGGLSETEEYKAVESALNSTELTYDDVALNVMALNAICKDAMTSEFLAQASDENPIDLTSFIVNPNIYQKAESTVAPDGWNCDTRGSADNKYPTSDSYTDSDLFCYSWSGNDANNIGNGHYFQKIGGDREGVVNLPDGLYELHAATYTDGGDGNIYLYASTDSVNFVKSLINTDVTKYDSARAVLGVTTEVLNVEVKNGQLYIGVKGKYVDEPGYVGGLGRSWKADNFRLYYVSSSALTAYVERLQERLAQGQTVHETLVGYNVDDEDLAICLEEFPELLANPDVTVDELSEAIEAMDVLLGEAETVISNYETFNPLLVNGTTLSQQLTDGAIVAQPTVTSKFNLKLEEAAIFADGLSWESLLGDEVVTLSSDLQTAINDLLASVAICYPLSKAKVLADQIGGLSEEDAYKTIVNLLKSDNIDQLDADMATLEMNALCVNAMTPEVLATATPEKPFDMTSFIVNPNIYQNSVTEAGDPTNTVVNGWTCVSNADAYVCTSAVSGDTELYCYSWSGHADHNAGSPADYSQAIGTGVAIEGKIALPTGAYRIEAATITSEPGIAGKLDLYGMTRSVSTTTVPDISGNDSTVYVYADSVYVTASFNGDEDVWKNAVGVASTTTYVPEVYVTNGELVIGVKGNSVIGGNGKWWKADNFRLYYVGTQEGVGVEDAIADETQLSDYVDVYDFTGKLIRKQVKREEAAKGLAKGLYIIGGKKIMIK